MVMEISWLTLFVDNCSNSIHGQNMGKEHDTLIPLEWRIWIYCRIDPHVHYFDTPRKPWWSGCRGKNTYNWMGVNHQFLQGPGPNSSDMF